MFDVVSFGSAVVDVFVDSDASEKGKSICYPVGSKILLKNLKFDIGGGGTNSAVAFSRLGLRTGCICNVGDDSDGVVILALLKSEGVKFLGKMKSGETSGYSIVLDSRANDRTILTYKGVNDLVDIRELPLRKIRKTKWLYLSSLLKKSFESQVKLALDLKSRGVKIAFNPSDYLIKRKDLRKILRVVNVLVLNKEEGELLLKKNRVRECDLLRGLQSLTAGGIVVVTDRDRMISCYDGVKKYYLKPHKVKVVERTGAGDAFASGFVAGVIAGFDIEKSLRLGLEESESVIKYFGAKNKLIKRKIK